MFYTSHIRTLTLVLIGVKKIYTFAFQVSGALTFGIRPLSRRLLRSAGSPLGRLPEFLKCFGYNPPLHLCGLNPKKKHTIFDKRSPHGKTSFLLFGYECW